MKSGELKSIIELIAYLLLGIVPLFGLSLTENIGIGIALLIVSVVVLCYFGYILVKKLIQNKREKSSMSNHSVIKNARRYCKTLLKYARVSQKKLLKTANVNKAKRIRDLEYSVVQKIKGSKKEIRQAEKLKLKIEKIKINFSDKTALNLMRSLTPRLDYEVSQILSNTFINLERILLNTDQFYIRIQFGNYIKNFSDIIIERVKADIDYIGWTYIMMGRQQKGEKAILSGIALAQDLSSKRIKTDEVDDEIKKALDILVIRGYRHLGSARFVYENNPAKAIEHLNKASELLEIYTNEYKNHIEADLQEMNSAIKYGLMISELYAFKLSSKSSHSTDDAYVKIFNQYNEFNDEIESSATFSNKHRYFKYLVLKAKYLEILYSYFDHFKKHLKEKFDLDKKNIKDIIKDSHEYIRDIFKNNIFMDEAVEYYLESSVKYLKYDILEQIEVKQL